MAASGTHRTRAVVRYLPSCGWQPVIITVQKPAFPADPALLHDLPKDLAVYRTLAPEITSWTANLKRIYHANAQISQPNRVLTMAGLAGSRANRFLGRLLLPDPAIGWLPFAVRAALRAVKHHQCDAIYSTSPPLTTHLIGMIIKRRTGLPWVADFRDPWRNNPFRNNPHRMLDRLDALLEERVVNTANRVICNSETVREDFVRRYRSLASRFVTIPNGFDPDDYAKLEPVRPVGHDRLVLTHAGYFYGPRRPEPIIQALRPLREMMGARVPCLQLIGPPFYRGQHLREIAERNGGDEMVLVTGELPHQQALQRMKGSDILLVVGIAGKGAELQVPGKLFEYIGVDRPLLALAPQHSAIADIIAKSGALGRVCDPDDPIAIANAVLSLSRFSVTSVADSCPIVEREIDQFDRRKQVAIIASLLNSK
ncbi:glycosyltransferase [Singulisphaera sp. GP187]|uniref:glycosyltransferase n=1 Tax=Singulisphaera sp. GP187 TaxID=1882752 RepID=UPI0009414544|nr:glycosyltransferase [Singulisphaera sp. GP187]